MVGIVDSLILILVGKAQECFIPEALLAILKPALWGMAIGLFGHIFLRRPTPAGFRPFRKPVIFWFLFSIGLFASLSSTLYGTQTINFLIFKFSSLAILFAIVTRHLTSFDDLESTTKTIVVNVLLVGLAMVFLPKALPMSDDGGPPRVTVGGTYDPNDLALLVAMSFPFLFYWFWRGGIFAKAIVLLASALALFVVYRTGSRGGMLSIGIVMLYILFRVPEAGWAIRGMLAIAMVAGGAVATQTSTFKMLVEGIQGKDYNADSEDGRLAIWQRGIGYAMKYPITGVGAECFTIADELLSGRKSATHGVKYSTAHNSYIQLAVEVGFPATICWLLMLLTALREVKLQRRAWKPYRKDPVVRRFLVMGGMIRCSIIAFMVGGFFLSLGYFPMLFLTVGYAVAYGNIGDIWLAELEANRVTAET